MKKVGYVGSVIPIRVRIAPTSELVKAKVVGASAELVQPTGMIDLKTSLDQETGVISTLVGPEQYVREGVYTVFVKAVFDDGSDAPFPVELEVMPRLVGGPVAPHVQEMSSDVIKSVDKPEDKQYIPYSHMKAIQAYDPTIGFSTRLSALYDLKFYHCEDLADEKLQDDWRIVVAWWCTLVPDENTLLYPVDKVIDLAAKIAKEFKKRHLTIPREFGSSDQQELYEILREHGVDMPDVTAPGEEEDKNNGKPKGDTIISKAEEKLDDSEHRSSPAETPGSNIQNTDELTKGNTANAGMHKHIIPGHPGFEEKEHPISQVHTDVPTTAAKTALPTRSRPSLGQVHNPAPAKYMQEHADPGKHLDDMLKAFDGKIREYDPLMRVSMFDGRKHLTTSMDDLACWNCPRVEEVGNQLWCPLMGIVDPLQVCRFYGLPVFIIGIGDADDLKKSKETSLLEELLEWCKKHKITVKMVPEQKLKDFQGMNDAAAKKYGYDEMGEADIQISETRNGVPISDEYKLKTLYHELVERHLIGDQDMSYWKAHVEALGAEQEVKKAPEELICAVGPQAKLTPVMVQRGGKSFASHRFKGRFHGKPKRGQTHTASGQKIPEHWTHVILATRSNSPLQAVGKDAAGRTQYLYSSARTAKKAAQKWDRLKSFGKVVTVLDAAIEKKAARTDEGMILDIIKHTGLRIGSDKDTKAKVKAYGVSTLLAKHVKVEGDRVEFNFIGKEGVRNRRVIHDQQIADGMAKRLSKAKSPEDRLFNTTDDRVREEFHALPHANSFLIKDWRTLIGTQTALAAMKKMPMPKNAAQFIKYRRDIAKKIAIILGNTPSVALKYYCAPEVFSAWLGHLAVQGVDIKKEEGGYSVDSGDADTNRVGGYQFGSGAIMKAEDTSIGMPVTLEELFDSVQYDTEGSGWEHDSETEYDPDEDVDEENS